MMSSNSKSNFKMKSLDEAMNLDSKDGIIIVKLEELYPFPNHPYIVRDDKEMEMLVSSISSIGVQTPLSIMKRPKGGYYIIAGHRRYRASEIIGLTEVPAILRNCSMEEAIREMVDSNIYRELILPSEKAKAYKMRMEAENRQGERTDLTSRQIVGKSTAEIIGEAQGDNERTVQRYIRLTLLNDDLLEMVDKGQIKLIAGVDLSYLTEQEQDWLTDIIYEYKVYPTGTHAALLKSSSKDGILDITMIINLFLKDKSKNVKTYKLSSDVIAEYLPKEVSDSEAHKIIIEALKLWKEARMDSQRRGSEE